MKLPQISLMKVSEADRERARERKQESETARGGGGHMATQIYLKLGNLPERSVNRQSCRVICLPSDRQTTKAARLQQHQPQHHQQQTRIATSRNRWQNAIFKYNAIRNDEQQVEGDVCK